MEEAARDVAEYQRAGGREMGQAYAMLGMGYMRGGAYGKANDSFVQALQSGYANPESLYYYVVLCAYLDGDYQRAREYGRQLIDRVSKGETVGTAEIGVENETGILHVTLKAMDYSALCRMTGMSCMSLSDFSEAAEIFTQALERKPDDAYIRYLRGCCLLSLADYAAALTDFDAAIAAGEQIENSRYSRGICRMQLGDAQGAAEDLEWVIAHGGDASLREEAAALTQVFAQDEADGASPDQ